MPKNEVDDFLDGLDGEGSNNPFETESKDPFTNEDRDTAEETKDDETTEKTLPFHKDPKVQRYIQKEVARATRDIPQARESNETERFTKETASASDSLKDVLSEVIGNDTPEKRSAVDRLHKEMVSLEDKGARKALEEINQRSQRETEEEQEAQEELTQAFDDIEDTFNVDITSNSQAARKTRNDFIDFVKEVAPKDEDGQVTAYPDFQRTFALFKEINRPQSNSRAKELANRSMSRSADASSAPAMKDNSWKAVDKLLGKLTG